MTRRIIPATAGLVPEGAQVQWSEDGRAWFVFEDPLQKRRPMDWDAILAALDTLPPANPAEVKRFFAGLESYWAEDKEPPDDPT